MPLISTNVTDGDLSLQSGSISLLISDPIKDSKTMRILHHITSSLGSLWTSFTGYQSARRAFIVVGVLLTALLLTVNVLAAQYSNEVKLTASDPGTADNFGISIATSGDTAIIGAFQKNSNTGVAYVFTRSGTSWSQQQKLTASDAASPDEFGFSVAISGDTAIVGAHRKAGTTGAAYIFVRSGTVWSQQQELTASDAAANDDFGSAVAISRDTVLVGADQKNSNAGASYVFTRTGTTWSQQQKLTASDAAANSFFGRSVAMDQDTAIIGGASEAGYVFTRTETTWSQQQKLTASDAAVGDHFGNSVAVSGDTVTVGAYGKSSSTGAAYIFTRSGTVWTQQQKLTATGGAANDNFGYSVALSVNTAVIGAGGRNSSTGAAYVFTRSGTAWTQQQVLTASDQASGDMFGIPVAADAAIFSGAAAKTAGGFSFAGVGYAYIPNNTATDLRITDSVSDSTPDEDQAITYTITASNIGVSPASAVLVKSSLPSGVTFDSAIPSSGVYDSTSGYWKLDTLAASSSATLTVNVTVNAGTGSQTLIHSAEINGLDTNMSNNLATASLTVSSHPVTITVNTAGDTVSAADGLCSLREAITASNTSAAVNECPGGLAGQTDTIVFNIAGSGVKTIHLTSPLPALINPVIIDGMPSFNCVQGLVPTIEIEGTNAGAGANGLVLSGGGATVRGLVIDRFSTGSGILITSSNNAMNCNDIGIDGATLLGTEVAAPNQYGIKVSSGSNNLIGRNDGNFGANVVGGNSLIGIWLTGAGTTNNQVAQNVIGWDGLSNTVGIRIDGGASGNLIGGDSGGSSLNLANAVMSNSAIGIELASDGNVVQGNTIGLHWVGTVPHGNGLSGGSGIAITGNNNLVGGMTHSQGNIISGNLGGVSILSGSGNTIVGNTIGLDQAGDTAVGNQIGITVAPQNAGSPNQVLGNVISGNSLYGVWLGAISGVPDPSNADSTIVSSNVIGADAARTGDRHNGSGGVVLNGVSGTRLSGNLIVFHAATSADFGVQTNNATLVGSTTNCVTGNAKGLVNTTATSVSFTDNWWGSPGGPVVGTDISGTGQAQVTFSPFLTSDPATCGSLLTFPIASLTPTSNPFGDVLVGQSSSPVTFTLTNTGSANLHMGQLIQSGSNKFTLSANTCAAGSTIIPAGTCSFKVTFSPTATGSVSGSVDIHDDAPGQPQTVTFTGNGIQPAASLTPATNPFGNVLVGQSSSPVTFTLTNTGSAPLHVGTVTQSGSTAFTLDNNTCAGTPTLAPNDTCTLDITFSPTATGHVSGGVSIGSDAPGQPSTVSFDGTGVQPGANLLPGAHDFGPLAQAVTSAPFSFTLTNVGGATLNISNISATGDFAISGGDCGPTPFSMSAGDSCSISVTFRPTAAGQRSGTLSVSSDGPTSPVTADLKGTGLNKLAPPALRTPKNGAIVTRPTVKLVWKTVKGALGYHVQLDQDSGFSAPRQADPTRSNVSFTLSRFGVYFWRVATKDALGLSVYQSPFHFEYTLNKTPRNGAALKTGLVHFKWAALKGKKYILQVYTDDTDESTRTGSARFTTLPQSRTAYAVPKGSALPRGIYYWRVSIDGGATWTNGWWFKVP